VVLGLNNQRSGFDGRARTLMTSMRTFEALACGKPLLAAHSDAYERLGLAHGEHLAVVSTPQETLDWADRLLGVRGHRMAEAGRHFVLERHTYGHRLSTIAEIVCPRTRSKGTPRGGGPRGRPRHRRCLVRIGPPGLR
jgi:spore maturation protein CgeB